MKLEPLSMERKSPFHLMNQNVLQSQDSKSTYEQIYDDEFVSLINRLNESIKEYYKVSKNNITDASSLISFYEDQGKSIQEILDHLTNEKASVGANDIVEQFSKINDIMTQLQINVFSNEKNLNLFFEDAKILFKKMKMKRKQKITELKNNNLDTSTNLNSNRNRNNILNDSYSNSFNNVESSFLKKNKLNQGQMSYKKINVDNNNMDPNNKFLLSINNIYLRINRLINSLSEFNNMINKMNIEASNKYNNLQNNIKKELDNLMNLIKSNANNSIINNKVIDDQKRRSQSIPNGMSKEFENLKQIRQINEKKIEELNYELNNYKINMENLKNLNSISANINTDYEAKIRELQINNNNLTINLMKAQQLIKEKDNLILSYQSNLKNPNNNNINNNLNTENSINIKNPQIMQLQQQIKIYQNNEALLHEQINNLNNKIQAKINEYEAKLSSNNDKNTSLSRIILKKNKDVQKLQSENNKYKNEIQQLQKAINSQSQGYVSPVDYQNEIQRLTNEINNYQNLIYQYENKINELSQNKSVNLASNVSNNNSDNFGMQKRFEILNKEMQLKESEFINKNVKNGKIIEELKKKLTQLNKEILNYQKKEKYYEDNSNKYIKQIEDMNNNILYTNKILEQKDELIKKLNQKKSDKISNNNINLQLQKENKEYQLQIEQLQKKYITVKELLEEKNSNNNIKDDSNIDNLKIKLTEMQIENEKLRKQIEEFSSSLKSNNNINGNEILLKDKIINGNNDLITKINDLTLENQRYKENISKLENDINKKNEELEGFKNVIYKQQTQLEKKDDEFQKQKEELNRNRSSHNILSNEPNTINTEPNRDKSNKKLNHNKSFDAKDQSAMTVNNLLSKLKDAEKKINNLQDKNKELRFKLEEKTAERELSGYRTEDVNFSNYEEEFDLKRMVNGARDKNRSEDINIDYPGIQILKDKYREAIQNMNMLEEQVKILLCNISFNNKIKPQITQICQLMRIPPKNIQLVLAGKDKKKALGLIN